MRLSLGNQARGPLFWCLTAVWILVLKAIRKRYSCHFSHYSEQLLLLGVNAFWLSKSDFVKRNRPKLHPFDILSDVIAIGQFWSAYGV